MSKMMYSIALFFVFFVEKSAQAYKTYYLADYCEPSVETVIELSETYGFDSAVIVHSIDPEKAKDFDPTGLNCSLVIQAPPAQGIIMSFKHLYIQASDSLIVKIGTQDPMLFAGVKWTQDFDDETDRKSYPTDPFNNYIKIFMITQSNSIKPMQFDATFTTYQPINAYSGCGTTHFRCKNNNCIWKELKCDLRDNCGDFSDETKCNPSLTATIISAITLLIIATTLGILYVWLTCKRCRDPSQVYESRIKLPSMASSMGHGGDDDVVDYYSKYKMNLMRQQNFAMPPSAPRSAASYNSNNYGNQCHQPQQQYHHQPQQYHHQQQQQQHDHHPSTTASLQRQLTNHSNNASTSNNYYYYSTSGSQQSTSGI